MNFRFLLFLLSGFIIKSSAFAQHEADNWLLNRNTGLNFTNGEPNLLTVNAKKGWEASASISDKAGNLLFYTNADTVWNKQHQVMANGTGLLGFKNATQNSLIIPKPGSSTLYYVFTQEPDLTGPFPGYSVNLRFSIVNMAAQNGLGEMSAAEKNVFLYAPAVYYMSRKLTAVHHANNRDIWLITHRFFNNYTHEFLAFKITSTGISAPVVSRIVTQTHDLNSYGGMKASPNGQYLAGEFGYSCQVFHFNNKTGNVSDLALLEYVSNGGPYQGIPEFSPDASKVYFSFQQAVAQYDLTSKIPATIISSKTLLSRLDPTSWLPNYGLIQLARNGKIYVTRESANFITEIANPNAAGVACSVKQTNLPPALLGFSRLPNFISSYFAPPRFTFTPACAGNPIPFTIADTSGGMRSPKWNFDDAASGSLNQSRSFAPSHSFSAAGTYNVSLTLYFAADSAVFTRQVIIPEKAKVSLGNDTTICAGSSFTLRNKFYDPRFQNNYRWSTGDTSLALTVTKPGTYWLELNDLPCPARDTITVAFETCPPPFLPNIITPNQDGKNDFFTPKYLPKGNWQLQIFNRWGKKIYETENYQNNWPQIEIPAGTYYYLLKEKATNQKFKGWLEVIK